MIVDIETAAQRLSRGEVVAYPTETVYGLGADAFSAVALERLLELKGRRRDSGLSVLVADLPTLESLVPALPAAARQLAASFWPGPLTIVVRADAACWSGVASKSGVGFRCSSHPTAAALCRASARPVVSTSCNRTGEPPCRDAAEVEQIFGATLAIAGGGDAGGASPSTVVAVRADGELELLREGALAYADLARVLKP